MSQQSDRFGRAAEYFETVFKQVTPAQWEQPTPCADWNVRQLMNHVLVEQLWVPPLLAGRTVADVGSAFDGDQLGDDPDGAWQAAVAESRAQFEAPGAMAGVVHLSYGDDSVENYCDQMTLDALVHGWDLANAINVDTSLPPDLVEWAYETVLPMQELLTASGMFGTPIEVSETSTTQEKLLGLLGRAI